MRGDPKHREQAVGRKYVRDLVGEGTIAIEAFCLRARKIGFRAVVLNVRAVHILELLQQPGLQQLHQGEKKNQGVAHDNDILVLPRPAVQKDSLDAQQLEPQPKTSCAVPENSVLQRRVVQGVPAVELRDVPVYQVRRRHSARGEQVLRLQQGVHGHGQGGGFIRLHQLGLVGSLRKVRGAPPRRVGCGAIFEPPARGCRAPSFAPSLLPSRRHARQQRNGVRRAALPLPERVRADSAGRRLRPRSRREM